MPEMRKTPLLTNLKKKMLVAWLSHIKRNHNKVYFFWEHHFAITSQSNCHLMFGWLLVTVESPSSLMDTADTPLLPGGAAEQL